MKAMVTGQILSVRSGTAKNGKPFTVADVYDGEDLLKIFGVDPQLQIGIEMSFPVRIRLRDDGSGLFISVTK